MINKLNSLAGLLLGVAIAAPLCQAASLTIPNLTSPNTLVVTLGVTYGTGIGFDFVDQPFLNPLDGQFFYYLEYTSLSQDQQGYGSYSDVLGSEINPVIVDPGQSLEQTYSSAGLGAGTYTFLSNTLPGTEVNASLNLYYSAYTVDPTSSAFNPITDYAGSSEVSAPINIFYAQVPGGLQNPGSAPEPAEIGIFAIGLLLVAAAIKRRRVTA